MAHEETSAAQSNVDELIQMLAPFRNSEQRIAADKKYIKFDTTQFMYSFDPLGQTLHTLCTQCKLIIDLNIPLGLLKDIVAYVGYIESKLGKTASCPYSSGATDCEMCFLLSMPFNSPYAYKYTLDSFKCHVETEGAKVCFKVATFYPGNANKLYNKSNELYNSGIIELGNSSDTEMPEEYRNAERSYVLCGEIIEFNNLNLKLANDQIYVMRVDVVEDGVGCAELDKSVDSLNAYINPEKVEMVCDRTRLYDDEYSLRLYDRGKLYEIVLF